MPRLGRSLTDEQALSALESVAAGQAIVRVADRLAVSRTVIDNLVNGRSYRHLARPQALATQGQGTYRGKPQTAERRSAREASFWALVAKSDDEAACWPFTGTRNVDGYGHFSAGRALIAVVSAHRIAYLLAHGLATNLPETVYIRHLCANPPCCNPAHLTTGTQRENMADRFQLHGDRPGPHPVDAPVAAPPGGWNIPADAIEDLELAARLAEFWRQIDNSLGDDACWPWTGASRHEFGYGFVYWEGRHTQASRVALILHEGRRLADVDGDVVRHLCPGGGNPSCCNPQHLAFGTQKQNMLDRKAEGKYASGDAHFASKLRDSEILAIREEYWNLPQGQRPTLESLGDRFGMYWGTVHRMLCGKTRAGAGGPTGELMSEYVGRTNHARGESHRMVTVSDATVKALREEYWAAPSGRRLSTPVLAKQYGTDSKTIWNWLHGKSRVRAGGPVGEAA